MTSLRPLIDTTNTLPVRKEHVGHSIGQLWAVCDGHLRNPYQPGSAAARQELVKRPQLVALPILQMRKQPHRLVDQADRLLRASCASAALTAFNYTFDFSVETGVDA